MKELRQLIFILLAFHSVLNFIKTERKGMFSSKLKYSSKQNISGSKGVKLLNYRIHMYIKKCLFAS